MNRPFPSRYHDWGLLAFIFAALLSVGMSSCNDERKDTTYPRTSEKTSETVDASASYGNTQVYVEFDHHDTLVYRTVVIDGVEYLATRHYDAGSYSYSLCPKLKPEKK